MDPSYADLLYRSVSGIGRYRSVSQHNVTLVVQSNAFLDTGATLHSAHLCNLDWINVDKRAQPLKNK